MNGGALVLRERGQVVHTTSGSGRGVGVRLSSRALRMLFGRGRLCYRTLIFVFSIKKRTTYQFAIKPTSVTIQLIIQTSPPKRGVSRSTVQTFSSNTPRTVVVVGAFVNSGV